MIGAITTSASRDDSVIAGPFRLSAKGATSGVGSLPVAPRLIASAVGASMCAPSRAPTLILSRMVAQETSRLSVTSKPSAAKYPRA